jgi:6-O-methylguanine DNA methyltransferase, DNA binding domain
MAMRSRTPWKLKLHPEQQPKVVADPRGRMLVPTPLLVARALRRVPVGRLITPAQLRARLARTAGADSTSPLTTGIFLNIIAGATEEALAEGRRALAPYWRVVDDRGCLPAKFPPGQALQAAHLRAEGHRVSRDFRISAVAKALVRR